jgi:TP901 family phage tail tape measure protein
MADMTTTIRIAVNDAFTANLKRLEGGLRGVNREASKLKDRFQIAAELNQSAEGMGRFGSAITQALRQPIQDFASLDQALARVSAKTGEARGSAAFETLKKQALDLGAATKYSAEEVALAQAEFAASGRNTREILGSVPTTLSLATAGSIDLARATAITNEVLNQFNLTADKTAHVQDVLARADEVSAAGVNDLGEALSYAGATAARMNIPLETTSALLASLANAGQKGSTGGTELSAFLSSIVAPSKMAKKALGEMGLSLEGIKKLQTDVATGNIDVAIRKLATLNAKLQPRESAELLDKIFGERGGRAASVLFRASLDTSDKGLASLIEKFRVADGAVSRTAKIMEESLAGSLEKTGGALKGLSTQLGETMAPTVKLLAADVAEWADGTARLAKAYPETVRAGAEFLGTVALLAVTFKGALLTASAYNSAVGVLTGSTARAAVTMGTLSAQTVALGAAAAGAGYMIGKWLNDTLELDKKIASALGQDGPQRTQKGTQEYRGDRARGLRGTVLNDKGEVLDIDEKYFGKRTYAHYKDTVGTWKPGMAPGEEVPDVVREAIAAGANSKAEINAYLKNRATIRAGLGKGTAPAGESPVVEVDRAASYRGETASQIEARLAALEQLAQSPAGVRAPDEELKAQTKILQKLLEEMRRGNRGPLPTTGGERDR